MPPCERREDPVPRPPVDTLSAGTSDWSDRRSKTWIWLPVAAFVGR
jgi:hypothetical protein